MSRLHHERADEAGVGSERSSPALQEPIKLWVDDQLDTHRPVPEGWVGVRRADEALALIRSGRVGVASLDHDLGHLKRDGNWLLAQVERDVALGAAYLLPVFYVHSANLVGRRNMEAAIAAITRLDERRQNHGRADHEL